MPTATDRPRGDRRAAPRSRRLGRPAGLLYGFDDLTGRAARAGRGAAGAAEVTVAVTYEDRAALAARARLLRSSSRELGAGRRSRHRGRPRQHREPAALPPRALLPARRAERREPDARLALLRRRRGARRGGADRGRVARAARRRRRAERDRDRAARPGRRGPLHAGVCAARDPGRARGRAPGRPDRRPAAACWRCCAPPDPATAADLLAYLRGPRRAGPGQVDWLERASAAGGSPSAAEAAPSWEGERRAAARPRAPARAPPRDPQRAAARGRRARPRHRRSSRCATRGAGSLPELERGARAAGRRADRRAARGARRAGTASSRRPRSWSPTLEALDDPAWTRPGRGPGADRQPLPPARRRASAPLRRLAPGRRVPAPRAPRARCSPTSSAPRSGLPQRAEPEAEERYLFARLPLAPDRAPLPLLPRPATRPAAPSRARRSSTRCAAARPAAPDDRDAPTRSRARSPAAAASASSSSRPAEAPARRAGASPGAPARADRRRWIGSSSAPRRRERIAAALADAAAPSRDPRGRGRCRSPAVLAELGAVPAFGASTLEGFDVCSYRWFVDHELGPAAARPGPRPADPGGLIHAVLERLYREPPGGDALPRPATSSAWLERGRELVAEVQRAELSEHPADRAMRRRVERLLVALPAPRGRAARSAPRARAARGRVRRRRGGGEAARCELGDLALHGRIDRVDRGADGRGARPRLQALAQGDTAAQVSRRRKLQLPLYLLALRELWGSRPVGGLYQPLRADRPARARAGCVREDATGVLGELGLYDNDVLDAEEFEAALERGRAARRRDRRRGCAAARSSATRLAADLQGHDKCPASAPSRRSAAASGRRRRADEDEDEEEAA